MVQKMPSFFFRELQFITVLLLICDFCMSWSTRFISLKLWNFPFSIPFHFYSILYFCSTKCMDSLTLKRHDSYQNQNNRKATPSFAHRCLFFLVATRSFKIQWYLLELELPKTDLMTIFFKPRKSKFWERLNSNF